MLTARSYRVGACTGNSAGSSLENAIDITRRPAELADPIAAVGEQAPAGDELAVEIDGGQSMSRSVPPGNAVGRDLDLLELEPRGEQTLELGARGAERRAARPVVRIEEREEPALRAQMRAATSAHSARRAGSIAQKQVCSTTRS